MNKDMIEPEPIDNDLAKLLKDYVATYQNPEYNGDWDVVNSKFPELDQYDPQLLKDYVATYQNPEYNGDWNLINSKFGEFDPLKKKDENSESSSNLEMDSTGSVSPMGEAMAEAPALTYASDSLTVNIPGDLGTNVRNFGALGEFTDWFSGAVSRGSAQGETVDDALALLWGGKDVSDLDIEDYIKDYTAMTSLPQAESMEKFTEIYQEEGGGVWGFLSALRNEPEVALGTLIESYTSMANKQSAIAAGTVVAGGGATGAVVSNVAAPAGFVAGAIASAPYAFAAAGGTLELAMSFNEFLSEELDLEGLEFNVEGVRKILENEDALERIRVRSAKRAGTITFVDALFGGLGGDLATKSYRATGKLVAPLATATATEIVGGGVGELAAEVISGQEIDAMSIGLEMTGAVGGVTTTLIGQTMNRPQTSINGQNLKPKSIKSEIENARTIKDLRDLNIKIKNAPELQKFFSERESYLEIDESLNNSIQGDAREQIIKLEIERKKIFGSPLKSNARRVKEIDQRIDDLLDQNLPEEERMVEGSQEPVVTTESETETPGEGTAISEVESPGDSPAPVSVLPPEIPRIPVRERELKDKQRKEGVFVGKGIKGWFDGWRRRAFSSRRFLPKSVRKFQETKDASVASVLNSVQQQSNKFEKLLKGYPKADRLTIMRQFDDILRGRGAVTDAGPITLPKDLQDVAYNMRSQIDALSRQLVDNGFVKADTKESILKNMGEYLTRSYKTYDQKNWKGPTSLEVIQKGKNFIRNQLSGSSLHKRAISREQARNPNSEVDPNEVLNTLVEQRFKDITTKGMDMEAFWGKGTMGSKDLTSLKQKKDVPPEIRALMGEYSNPIQNYANTIKKQITLLENSKFQERIRDAGMGVYFFDEADARPEGFDYKIAEDGSSTLDGIAGLYTTKEIVEEFKAMGDSDSGNWMMDAWSKGVGTVKWMKTLGSVETHAKNFIGNTAFMMANGHTNLTKLPSAMKTVMNDVFNGSNEALQLKMNRYIELGIVKQSAGLGEIRDLLSSDNWEQRINDIVNGNPQGKWDVIKRKFRKGKAGIEDFYGGTDDIFKIYAYENEVSRQSDAMFGKPYADLNTEQQQALDNKVTEIVKNTYPTYDRIPGIVKLISKAPMVGTFVAFTAESYRTSWNIASLAAKEIKSDNPKIRAIGAKRISGVGTYVSGKSSIIGYAGYAAGAGIMGIAGNVVDSDEEKERLDDINRFSHSWTKNSSKLISQASEGVISFRDMDGSDPFGAQSQMLNAALAGENPMDSFIKSMEAGLEDFVSPDILYKNLEDLKSNNSVYNETEDFSTQLQDVMIFLGRTFEPGTINTIRRWRKSDDLKEEFFSTITGMKNYDIPVDKAFYYNTKDNGELLSKAQKIIYSDEYEGNPEAAHAASVKAEVRILQEMSNDYHAAIRLGVEPYKLLKTMDKLRGMSSNLMSQIISGDIKGSPLRPPNPEYNK